MSIRVSTHAKISDNEDGSFLNVTIQNHLPCVSFKHSFRGQIPTFLQELPVDQVTVVLAGPAKERLRFSADIERIAIGQTSLTLFCAVSMPTYCVISD